jgi:GNAT superfamily N-acetyltransferase
MTFNVHEVSNIDTHDEETGLPLNADGTVTVYHHTSSANAAKIKATGILKSAGEPDVYVTTEHSTDSDYGANGYGDTPVPIMVNPSILVLDDEFPDGRKDFRINVGKPGGSIRVKVGDSSLTEMPAWNDGDKNIGNYMGKRHRMDVDSQYEKRGKKLEDFRMDNYQIRVYTNKLENELNYYAFYDYHEVAAFNWIKDGKFWKTISAAVAPEHQGKGLAFKAYTHMIDKYMHVLSSDATLTGETGGKGSFDLWVKLGKTYPFKYIYNREPSSRKLTKVDGFTRDMMEYDFERFIVSQYDLQEGIMESLRQDLRQIFFEGTIKVPTQEIEEWLKANLDDIITKAKESAAQGYETYTDNNITVNNPYTNEPLDVSMIFRKKLSIPDNDTIDPVLYFDAKSATIYVNASLILSLYKSKPSLYAGFLKSIIHELTHAIDPGRAHKKNDYNNYDEYVNNSVEFPAFANMYLNKLKNKIQSGKLQANVLADAIRSGKKIPDIEVGGFMNKLNPENRTKFINYIYKELLS